MKHVYMYKVYGAQFIKFGQTVNLKSRQSSYKTHSPWPGGIIWNLEVENPTVIEDIVRRRWAKYHMHGEWYDPPDGEPEQMMRYISMMLADMIESGRGSNEYFFVGDIVA